MATNQDAATVLDREKKGSAFCRHVRSAAQIDISHKWTLDDPLAAVVNSTRKSFVITFATEIERIHHILAHKVSADLTRKCDYISASLSVMA